MVLLNVRELLQFPQGNNATDVLINGIHFNRTALNYYNYTFYSNGTLSNKSACYLVFNDYKPVMFGNGTFVNGTSCYAPYYGIKGRGILGITFACLFALSIMFTLINLRKHGRLFLPSGKRFRAVGRRWQWYWLIVVGACGTISGFMGIDVDRAYLQGFAIVLQNFFFFLLTPGILAAIWESVRHWGSWQERQIYDRDTFVLRQDDIRAKKEFYMPLVFYLFGFMNFFLTVPRNWTGIGHQRSPEQTSTEAKPVATDGRFKAGAIFAFLAWCVICYSLRHSIQSYKPRNRGAWNSLKGFVDWAPLKFKLVLPLALVVLGYAATIAFEWDISPLKYGVEPGWIYGLGYTPVLLIIVIFEIFGYVDKNEDRILIEQRRERGRTADAEMGIARKPGWWGKRQGDLYKTPDERLKALAAETPGGGASGRAAHGGVAVELGPMAPRRPDPNDPFSDDMEADARLPSLGEAPASYDRHRRLDRDGSNSSSRSSTVGQRQPTRVRSMLDV